MADYTGATNSEPYLDQCIKTMIAIGNTYTRLQASEFKQLMAHYQASILSFASLLNSRTRFVMHLIGSYQNKDLVDRIADQILEIKTPSDLLINTIEVASQLGTLVTKINEYKTVIENANPSLTGILDIYSDKTNIDGVNLLLKSQEQSIFMNYLSLRNLISAVSKLNRLNNNYQDMNENWRETRLETIVSKPAVFLTEVSTYLNELLNLIAITDAVMYSCDLLDGLYAYTGYSTKESMSSFFNSKYDTIKATVIKTLP